MTVIGLCMALLTACTNAVDVDVQLIAPCDRPDLLKSVSGFKVSVLAPGSSEKSSVFSKQSALAEIVDLPLLPDTVVRIDTEEPPILAARSLPIDLQTLDGGDTVPLKLVISPVNQFASATDRKGQCLHLGNQSEGRYGHTLTYIPRVNKILIAGGVRKGEEGESVLLSSLELYDPDRGSIEKLPNMKHARAFHSATALGDGRVLLVGGFGSIEGRIELLRVGLLIDLTKNPPVLDEHILFSPRVYHSATLMAPSSANIVIAGGCTKGCQLPSASDLAIDKEKFQVSRSIEIFDANQKTKIEKTNALLTARAMHAASAISGQRIVFSGGIDASGLLKSVEIYDHASGKNLLSPGNSDLPFGLARHAQVTLDNTDRIAIMGGLGTANELVLSQPLRQVAFWNLSSGVESSGANLVEARAGHSAFMLDKGVVFLAGGSGHLGKGLAEKIVIDTQGHVQSELIARGQNADREWFGATFLPNNQVILAGGVGNDGQILSDIDIYVGN